ncbi:MAG: hypothetical protein PF541_09785 [Prolixibacteraceae bacterium]|jgi:hypothetical protein|nr:hypothetical protein [Prolixibacteraceae bacterium]
MEFIFLFTGFIVFGESLALYIGLFLVKKGTSLWIHKLNMRRLFFDAIAGLLISTNYFLISSNWYFILAAVIISVSIITHFKRTMEYLLKKENPFCANKALFVMNNIKMVLLFGLLFIVLPL